MKKLILYWRFFKIRKITEENKELQLVRKKNLIKLNKPIDERTLGI